MLTSPVRPPRAGPGRARRTAAAVALLLVAYGLLLALGDSRAGSVSDVGGKLATAKVMAEGERASLDVGYWAEDLDPDGIFHPLANSEAFGDRWVQGTSVPYSLLSAGLWRLAGPTGVAALSMGGGVLAAVAARRLARRLGDNDGWLAFWLVGLASPLVVYATDGWEHAPATGLALWGIVLALEAETPAVAALAGGAFATATLFRAELAVYVLSFGVACLLIRSVRTRWTSRPACIAATVVAAVTPLLLNGVLERWLLGAGVRDARASAGASSAGHEIGQRITDVLLTGGGLFPDESPLALATGVVLVGALLVLAGRVARARWATDPVTRFAAVIVVALYGFRLLDGLGFVPGAVAATPIVVLAAIASRNDETRVVLGTALGSLPLVWLFQWSGNHVPQWGGRYLLLSTVLLTVVAAAAIAERGVRAGPTPLLLGLTVLVAMAGAAWHVERTNVVGDAGGALTDQGPDTVVVALHPQLGRELGSFYGNVRWLSADAPSSAAAIAVARRADPGHIVVVERPAAGASVTPVPVPGYDLVEEQTVPYLGASLMTRTYARD